MPNRASNAAEVFAVVDASTLRERLEDVHTGTVDLGITDGKYASVLAHLNRTDNSSTDNVMSGP